MLFPYVLVRHRMGLMQGFVSYIFTKVWCKAPTREYSIDLFRGFPALFTIMDELDRENKAGQEIGAGAFFYSHVNEIFIDFGRLSRKEIRRLRNEFRSNNNIRALCEGRHVASRYPRGSDCSPLMQKIKAFFGKLYSSGFLNLKVVKDVLGVDVRDHYKSFAKANALPCCPFCGLHAMATEHDLVREAYDHYLPASVYPFNSVNMKNLAPACHECNSLYKGASDPLLNDAGGTRRAFYPYAKSHPGISISLRFLNGQIPEAPSDVEIDLSAGGYEEQLETWVSVYAIKQRYAAKSCGPVGGRYWMSRVMSECSNYEKTPKEVLRAELLACANSPWADASFLKAAFLKEADRSGLIE